MREYRLTEHEVVRVRERRPELLEAELFLEPGRTPPAHRHPSQDERYHVIEGVLRVRLDGTLIDVGPGKDLDIPRGTSHSMGAVGDVPVRAIWLTRPALNTEAWWTALDAATRRSASGRVPLAMSARALRAHRREFQLALPRFISAPLLLILSLLPPWLTRDPRDTQHVSQGAQ